MHGISTGAGFGSFGSIRNTLMPSQNNLNTWLKSATTDGKTLTNVEGTNATFTGTNSLIVGDGNKVISANNTGLGAGNFYYEVICKFTFVASSYIFGDGDTSTNNRWFALQHKSSTGGLNLVIDGDGVKSTHEVFSSSEVSDNDIVKIVVKREGSTVTSIGTNLTQDAVETNVYSNSNNFSGGNALTIGGISDGSGIFGFTNIEMFSFKAGTSETDLVTHYVFAEGSGEKVFDISGQGNHGLKNASYAFPARGTETSSLITSHNNLNGFDKDIFLGYEGYWDLVAAGSGTFQANANNLTLTGNTGVSGKLRQHVNGLVSGDTLVVSGTVVQTGATGGSNQDLAISSASAGWTQGSVFLGGEIGTYNFSTTLNANSSTCDIQFVVLNAANITISDLKFVVVKKIPSLINKTKQAVTFDGADARISYGLGSFNTSAWTVKFNITTDTALSNEGNILGQEAGTGTARLWLRIFGVGSGKLGRVVTFLGGSGETQLAPDGTIVANTNYDFELIYNGSGSLQLKTTTGGTTTTHPAVSRTVEAASGNLIFGDSHVGGQAGIIVTARSFEVEGLTKSDFEQGIGTTTITDISGQGNNGTVANATLSSFWGKRYVDSDGSIVGADYAVGNISVSNPSGYVHNGSECGLDLITTDVSASDIASINNASATQTFAKRDATNSELVTQLLQYSSTISGGDLVRTRRYVS
tara:strand:+ start:1434 stop:3530 length:2097 start_codon:yes stop_codon:yes gene_type:complete